MEGERGVFPPAGPVQYPGAYSLLPADCTVIWTKFLRSKSDDEKSPRELGDEALARVRTGADVLETYENLLREGKEVPAPVLVEFGDMLRDLGKHEQSLSMYARAVERYIADEAWSHAIQIMRRAERLRAKAQGDPYQKHFLLFSLQIHLGREEGEEARQAIEKIGAALEPSEGEMIERLVAVVDEAFTSEPELDITLAEVLIALGRPGKATERLQVARARAAAGGMVDLVQDIDARIPTLPVAGAPATRDGHESSSSAADTEAMQSGGDVPEVGNETREENAEDGDEQGSGGSAGSWMFDEQERGEEPEPAVPQLPDLEEATRQGDWLAPALSDEEEQADSADGGLFADEESDEFVTREERDGEWGFLDDGLEIEDVPDTPDPIDAAAMEGLDEDVGEPFVDIEELRGGGDGGSEDARVTGKDARHEDQDEKEEVRTLVEQLRAGIRDLVPEDEVASHYDLGISYMQMDMYDEAVEALQLAYRSPQFRIRAAEGLAQSFMGRGDALLARRTARMTLSAMDADDGEVLGLLYWQARAAEALERTEEALDLYERICVHDMGFLDAHERLNRIAD